LSQCQFKVTGWGIKTQLESGPVTADLTITVVLSSKLLINNVKPDHSLKIKPDTLVSFRFYNLVKTRTSQKADSHQYYISADFNSNSNP